MGLLKWLMPAHPVEVGCQHDFEVLKIEFGASITTRARCAAQEEVEEKPRYYRRPPPPPSTWIPNDTRYECKVCLRCRLVVNEIDERFAQDLELERQRECRKKAAEEIYRNG